MNRSKRSRKSRKTKLLASRGTGGWGRLWWQADQHRLLWVSDESRVLIKSLEHLQALSEGVPYVLVSGDPEQLIARVAALTILGADRVRIVMPRAARSSSVEKGCVVLGEKPAESESKQVIARPAVERYDTPLACLQMAVLAESKEIAISLDKVKAFRETWVGEFHQFWDLPVNSEAAEFWARVGDILLCMVSPEGSFPDLSADAELPIVGSDGDKTQQSEDGGFPELLGILFGIRKRKNHTPSPKWPIAEMAARIVARRALRHLLPAAWAGTDDPELQLQARLGNAKELFGDPRAWLWRGLLRSSIAEVNQAYVEAVISWVLARLIHPELFPPVNRLFDRFAEDYWRAHRGDLARVPTDGSK